MSSLRSRRGQRKRLSTFKRQYRSSRNLPSSTIEDMSLFVAAITRTSSKRGLLLPTRLNPPLSITRRSLTWASKGSSPISSRNSVPPSAASNLPIRVAFAPVNAPASCPKNSLSRRLGGIAPQLTTTKGPFRRALA